MGRTVRVTLILVVLAPVLAWAAIPWPIAYRWTDPAATAVMRYRVAEAARAGDTLELRQEWVPLDSISPNMVRAVIAAEDGRFRDHRGIDWLALAEELEYDGEPPFSWTDADDLRAVLAAGRYYAENRDEVRGRSTITQQLAKNLYFTPERSLPRKVAEFFIARRLERLLGKDRILELYLNTVELGPGLFGVGAAAREYFDVSAADLTRFQAASLAGSLPHPLTSNPGYRPGRMAFRRDLILRRLSGESGDLSPIPVAPEPIALPEGLDVGMPDADVAPTTEGDPAGTEPTTAPDAVPDAVSPPVEAAPVEPPAPPGP